MNRKECLISQEVGNLLVAQLAHEIKNFHLYKTFAAFFGREGIVDLEEYYNKRASEEFNHHSWIHEYLSESDFKFTHPGTEDNKLIPEDYIKPFMWTVDREIQTTQMIYAIYEQCISERDYMTASWLLQHLIKEQIEEENTSRMALSIMNQEADLFVKADKVLDLLG